MKKPTSVSLDEDILEEENEETDDDPQHDDNLPAAVKAELQRSSSCSSADTTKKWPNACDADEKLIWVHGRVQVCMLIICSSEETRRTQKNDRLRTRQDLLERMQRAAPRCDAGCTSRNRLSTEQSRIEKVGASSFYLIAVWVGVEFQILSFIYFVVCNLGMIAIFSYVSAGQIFSQAAKVKHHIKIKELEICFLHIDFWFRNTTEPAAKTGEYI